MPPSLSREETDSFQMEECNMDHSYDDERDAVVTEAETQDPNVRAVSDEEKAQFLADEEAAKGTSEHVRAVSDEEKAELEQAAADAREGAHREGVDLNGPSQID